MATDVDIANEALGKIGTRNTITSLAEATNEAKRVNQFFDQTRQEILQKAHWGFARAVVALTLYKAAPYVDVPTGFTPPADADAWTSSYPMPPWLYEYSWPSNALLVQAIVPVLSNYSYPFILANAAAFQIGSDRNVANTADVRVLLTNLLSAIAVYTKDVDDPLLYPPLFIDAFSSALAAKIALPLTGDKDLAKLMFALANDSIRQARADDANQGLTVIDHEASWITARFGFETPVYAGSYLAPYAPLYLA